MAKKILTLFVLLSFGAFCSAESKNLFNGNQGSGNKKVVWDATDNHGQPVSAGVYLYSIVAGENRQTKKMILLK